MVEGRFDWEKFENIMTGILGQLDVGEDVDYFAVLDENGEVKFWAGTRTLEGIASEIAPFMYRHTVNRTIMSLTGLHVVFFWVGGYLVALASKKESNIGFLVTLVENRFAEEIRRLESLEGLVAGEGPVENGGFSGATREAYGPGRGASRRLSARSPG